MPFDIVSNVPESAENDLLNGRGLALFQNYAQVQNAVKELIKKGAVLWGDRLHTIQTLLTSTVDLEGSTLTPIAAKALIFDIIQRTDLRYFERIKSDVSCAGTFAEAISLLRRNIISSEMLEKELTNRGSLKEFDLLTVYKEYERTVQESGLKDEGARTAELLMRGTGALKRLLPATGGEISSLIIDGADILTPAVRAFVEKIGARNTYFCQHPLPQNPIYKKMQKLIELNLGATPINIRSSQRKLGSHDASGDPSLRWDDKHETVNIDSDVEWSYGSKIDLISCTTPATEGRFIAREVRRLLEGGLDAEKIGVVVPSDAIFERKLGTALCEEGLIGRWEMEGSTAAFELKKIIKAEPSLDELLSALEGYVRERYKEAITKGVREPEIASRLRTAQELFDSCASLTKLGVKFELAKDILADSVIQTPKVISESTAGFELLRWGEDIYPKLTHIFIPALYQGGTPPSPRSSVFFQETSFLPQNAPHFFAELFPQQDMGKAHEIMRLRRYIASASSKVTLTYPRIISDSKETHPANIIALIKDVQRSDQPQVTRTKRCSEAETARLGRIAFIVNKDRTAAPDGIRPVIYNDASRTAIRKRFEEETFSASRLETYARCPYQFYLSKVLKLEPLTPSSPEVAPKDRGTIIHYIMELFYKNEFGNVLEYSKGKIGFEKLIERIEHYTEQAMNEQSELLEGKDRSLIDHFKKKATNTSVEAVRKDTEIMMDMEFPMIPKHMEWEFGKGSIPCLELFEKPLEKKAKLTGCVDRIDIDDLHNTYAITDYKTGSTDPVPSAIRNGEHLQLPIYLKAASTLLLPDKKAVAGLLFSLKDMAKKHGIALKSEKDFYFKKLNRNIFVTDDEWQILIDSAITKACEYITAVRNAEFTEKRDACKGLCDYRGICRYEKK